MWGRGYFHLELIDPVDQWTIRTNSNEKTTSLKSFLEEWASGNLKTLLPPEVYPVKWVLHF